MTLTMVIATNFSSLSLNDLNKSAMTTYLNSMTEILTEVQVGDAGVTKTVRSQAITYAADQANVQRGTSSSVAANTGINFSAITIANSKAHLPVGHRLGCNSDATSSAQVDSGYVTNTIATITTGDLDRADVATGRTVRMDWEVDEVLDSGAGGAGVVTSLVGPGGLAGDGGLAGRSGGIAA